MRTAVVQVLQLLTRNLVLKLDPPPFFPPPSFPPLFLVAFYKQTCALLLSWLHKVAIKVIRIEESFRKQALIEIELLQELNSTATSTAFWGHLLVTSTLAATRHAVWNALLGAHVL